MTRLLLFGGCAVVSPNNDVKGAATQQRRLAILAVLARAGDRGVSRTRILSLFWPDESDDERSRKALAQAIYALRRDLGDENIIVGAQELRLDAELLPHDVGAFSAAIREQRHADAIALYKGPFLNGFHLAGATEFERWAEEERRVLERDYAKALEKLAKEAERSGRFVDAIDAWRKLAAIDPLDSRATLSLMRALAANGETATAIRQAAIHETLIQQELDLPPDRQVAEYAATLRKHLEEETVAIAVAGPVVEVQLAATIVATPVASVVEAVDQALLEAADAPVDTTKQPLADHAGLRAPTAASERVPLAPHNAPLSGPRSKTERRSDRMRGGRLAVGAVLLAAVGWIGLQASTRSSALDAESNTLVSNAIEDEIPNLAVGMIADYRDQSSGPVRSLAALLATSLARGSGVRVVSAARISELLQQVGMGDTTEAAYIAAARRAGASELVDGSLYDPGDGLLRLDLRRVDVASGAVRAALTIRARDLFALADSGTARMLEGFGLSPLSGSVAEVTTRSDAALRFFAEGVRASAGHDRESARRLFGEALREDSLFAMAAYQYARMNPNRAALAEEMERALSLARRASTRERLIIQAGWASTMQRPGLKEIADSLLLLNPDDPQALLYAAEGRLNVGYASSAIPLLERALTIDSVALSAVQPDNCHACDAVQLLTRAYFDEQDPDRAVGVASRWATLHPQSADAWALYARVLDIAGRNRESENALDRTLTLNPAYPARFVRRVGNLTRAARFREAEALAREEAQRPHVEQRADGWWQLVMVLRQEGRMREALEAVKRFRAVRDTADGGRMALNHAYVPALMLHEAGYTRDAVALFDSMAAGTIRRGEHESNVKRLRTIALTAAADFTASLGDTAALPARLRAIEAASTESGVARDTRAHHYVRGLIYRGRGRMDLAISEWRAAMAPPLRGYHSRINLELARALLMRGEAEEAIRVIRPVMRDVIDGVAVSHTELREVLAQAHFAAGRRDSAALHRDWVMKAWSNGDPAYRERAKQLQRLVN